MPYVNPHPIHSGTKEDHKLFSIVIATYNCGRKIRNTLDSIFAQQRDLFEVIVVDRASKDGSLDHIENYADDITLISEEDDGIYFAFNKGIERSKGQYLYFIGAGDTLRPNTLERVKEDLPSGGTPALVYGKCYAVDRKVEFGGEFECQSLVHRNICQQGIFYKREVFDLIGRFDLQYKILSDWAFNLKCFISDEIDSHYLDYVVANYEGGGLSSEMDCDPVFVEEFPLLVKKHFGALSYFRCKTSLTNQQLFRVIYARKFHYLPVYIASQFKSGRAFIDFIKPYAKMMRRN